MIDIKGITKSFGSLQVLKGIDLHINKGEVVSIVGPSGAGKTTLLQIMGTLDKPDSGEIIIDGTDVRKLSSKKLSEFRNKRIGFVFQFHQLLPEFTAIENIMIPAFIAGMSKSEAKKRAKELLDFMGLADRAGHKPNELSGGEKQRVAVARALVNRPAVILADEPSGSLDSRNKAELHQLFFDLRDKTGQTFVIVTHDESLAKITPPCCLPRLQQKINVSKLSSHPISTYSTCKPESRKPAQLQVVLESLSTNPPLVPDLYAGTHTSGCACRSPYSTW